MGVVVVEFENEGDVAVFADFARRMGAKVDFRFGCAELDGVGAANENLCGCKKRVCTKKGFACKNKAGACKKGFFKE